jgi:GT2 family glycosyltransferase
LNGVTNADSSTFSVIVPTMGRPDDLRRCLERLMPGAQSLSADRYEVIVTDDSAAHAAAPIVAAEFPWARVVEGPRRGPASNRNAGARVATREWIAFVDDDCLPSRGWLAALATMAAGPGQPELIEGRTTCEAGIRSPLDHAPINEDGGAFWSCNLAVRRDAFARVGMFDQRFPHPHMEDAEFRDRALARGLRAAFARDAVVDHPPRRLAFGSRLAALHYGEVLYARIRGVPFARATLLRQVTMTRLRAIRRHGGRDIAPAIASWIAECLYIVNHWTDWERIAIASVASPAAP